MLGCCARYDDEADVVTSYQKIYLEDLSGIEIGKPAMQSAVGEKRKLQIGKA